MGFFGGMIDSYNSVKDRKQKAANDRLSQATSLAALQDSGYELKGNTLVPNQQFGQVPEGFVKVGGKVMEDPSYLSPKERVSMAKDEAATKLYNSRAGQGETLTPGRQLAKDKMTQKIFETVEMNKPKFGAIASAEKSLPNVPQGFGGKIKMEFMKRFDPTNPTLTDWQNLKTVLTDAQLMNTAKTKGAISDREMALFASAAANDDIMSVARMTPALNRVKAALQAEQEGLFGGFKQSYGEDPQTWFGEGSQDQQSGVKPSQEGYKSGTIVNIKGKMYRVVGGDPNDPELEEV